MHRPAPVLSLICTALLASACTPQSGSDDLDAANPSGDTPVSSDDQPTPTPARALELVTPYKALGTEPFWGLTIADANISFDDANDPGPPLVLPLPSPTPIDGGVRYASNRFTLDIVAANCSDGMSDRVYAHAVTFSMGAREWRGCGGAILRPAALSGTSWYLVGVDGSAPLANGDSPPQLRFDDGRVTGSFGCNTVSGCYREAGDRIAFDDLAQTEMACFPRSLMDQEARLIAVFASPLALSFDDRGRMILTGAEGTRLVYNRSI